MNTSKRHDRFVQTRKPSRDPRLQWGEEFAGWRLVFQPVPSFRQSTTNREPASLEHEKAIEREQAEKASLKWAQYFLYCLEGVSAWWPRTHNEEFARSAKRMDIEYILSPRTNGANPFTVWERLSKINTEVMARRIKALRYDEFLETAYWFAVATKVKSDAGMRCQVCNGTDQLNVHHRTYDTHGYEHLHLNDLTVLDMNCHGLFHGQLEPVPKKLLRPRRERLIPTVDPVDVSDVPDPVQLTKELIDRCRTNGSFTSATLRGLGLALPMRHGWIDRLVGTFLPRSKYKEALEGRFRYGTKAMKRHALAQLQ